MENAEQKTGKVKLTIEQKKARLKQQLAELETKEKQEARKREARIKILLGAFVLSKYKDPVKELAGFAEYLQKDQDRELFGLPRLNKE